MRLASEINKKGWKRPPKKYFNQLSGACSTQKLVEIHNNYTRMGCLVLPWRRRHRRGLVSPDEWPVSIEHLGPELVHVVLHLLHLVVKSRPDVVELAVQNAELVQANRNLSSGWKIVACCHFRSIYFRFANSTKKKSIFRICIKSQILTVICFFTHLFHNLSDFR